MRPGRFGAVLVAAGAVAVAASVHGCAATAGKKKATSPDDVVCTYEPVTGSHIVESRCQTRRQIDERRAADRAAVERMLTRPNRPASNAQPGRGTSSPQ